MLIPLLGLAYAGTVLYQVFVVQGVSLDTLYAYHPMCASLFIVFATLGMGAAQSIRGSIAQSRASKEPYVTRHALLNWLALFSLLGAGATIYLVRLMHMGLYPNYGRPGNEGREVALRCSWVGSMD